MRYKLLESIVSTMPPDSSHSGDKPSYTRGGGRGGSSDKKGMEAGLALLGSEVASAFAEPMVLKLELSSPQKKKELALEKQASSDAQLAELRLEKELTDVLEAAIKACKSFPESEQVSTNFLWLVAKGKRDKYMDKYMKASAETAGVDVASPEFQKMLDEV